MSRLRALSTCNTRYKMVYTPLFLMAPAVAQAAWQVSSARMLVHLALQDLRLQQLLPNEAANLDDPACCPSQGQRPLERYVH